jgi:hypothetical protein
MLKNLRLAAICHRSELILISTESYERGYGLLGDRLARGYPDRYIDALGVGSRRRQASQGRKRKFESEGWGIRESRI